MHLTLEERNLMLGLLGQALEETRVGIHHATISTYRDRLKGEESVLKSLIERVRCEPVELPSAPPEKAGHYMGA